MILIILKISMGLTRCLILGNINLILLDRVTLRDKCRRILILLVGSLCGSYLFITLLSQTKLSLLKVIMCGLEIFRGESGGLLNLGRTK